MSAAEGSDPVMVKLRELGVEVLAKGIVEALLEGNGDPSWALEVLDRARELVVELQVNAPHAPLTERAGKARR